MADQTPAQVAWLLERLDQATHDLDQRREAFDRAILDAYEAGVGGRVVAEETGLSHKQVRQIVRTASRPDNMPRAALAKRMARQLLMIAVQRRDALEQSRQKHRQAISDAHKARASERELARTGGMSRWQLRKLVRELEQESAAVALQTSRGRDVSKRPAAAVETKPPAEKESSELGDEVAQAVREAYEAGVDEPLIVDAAQIDEKQLRRITRGARTPAADVGAHDKGQAALDQLRLVVEGAAMKKQRPRLLVSMNDPIWENPEVPLGSLTPDLDE